jgi:hypothetical protein
LLDFIRPTEESATVLGHDNTAGADEIRDWVGVLPDGFDLWDRSSGYKHLEFALESTGGTATLDELLDRVGLDQEAAFTSIALGVSAVAGSRRGAMGGAVGSYVFFTILWNPIVAGIHFLVEGELAGIDAPAWYLFLQRLSPLEAYRQAIMELLGENVFGLFGWEFIVANVDQSEMADGGLIVSNRVAGELPFYLTEWFAVVVLFAWLVVPILVGLRYFERADLN